MLSSLILRHGYLALTLGTFIEGETVVASAGTLAHAGLLWLPAVIGCAFCGSFGWDQLWFELGRRCGRRLLRPERWPKRAAQVERWISQHGRVFVLAYRFIPGLGTLAPIALGASGFRRRSFLAFGSLGAALWASALAGYGWALAAGLQRLSDEIQLWQQIGAVLASTALLGGVGWLRARTRPMPPPMRLKSSRDT